MNLFYTFFLVGIFFCISLAQSVFPDHKGLPAAEGKAAVATAFPDISLIGNFVGTFPSAGRATFSVSELEMAIQHYLYPSVKADVFLSFDKEEGAFHATVEEGYVTFLNLLDVAGLPGSDAFPLELIVGRKLLPVGRINPLHSEQWLFSDRPLPVTQFLGVEEGIAGEGLALSYLLPVPFFSQLQVGAWQMDAAAAEPASGMAYRSPTMTSRLFSSFSTGSSDEWELGFNGVWTHAWAFADQTSGRLWGADLRYTHLVSDSNSLIWQSELYQADYPSTVDGTDLTPQWGGYTSLSYQLNRYHQLGIRFGWLGNYGLSGGDQTQWSFAWTRYLTETTRFRIQYNTGQNTESAVLAQFTFGMGPHSHVMQ